MSFNKDEMIAPDWMDSDFFKQVLEHSQKYDNIKIIDYEITPGSMLGDHFASIMFRANIKYSTNQNPNANISIIMKTFPIEEGLKKEMLESIDIFETEIFMYSKVLPTCKEIVRQAGYEDLLAPKMLYHALEPRKIIVFEDLKELGYSMYQENPPKVEDLKKIIAKLAQVHASTFMMAADGNAEITKMRGTCFGIKDIKNLEVITTGLPMMIDIAATIPELELCIEKLKQFTVEDLLDKCIGALSIPGSYNVLNHGDYHIKNMMFKNNKDNDNSEVVLVDFQLCHWGSPAHDLLYFAVMLPFDSREEIFKEYFNTFIDIINKSGYKGILPTYAQFEEELVKYRHIEIFIMSTFAPFLLVEANEIEHDIETLMTNIHTRVAFFKTKKYASLVKQMLPIYLERGYFDDIINKDQRSN